jgi:hypothetical protein
MLVVTVVVLWSQINSCRDQDHSFLGQSMLLGRLIYSVRNTSRFLKIQAPCQPFNTATLWVAPSLAIGHMECHVQ